MKRRSFVTMLGGTAAVSCSPLRHKTGTAGQASGGTVPQKPEDNFLDYFNDVPSQNSDLIARYFPQNLDASVQYDVIIIGSGMGGGILADATSDAGLKTLVLEAGTVRHFVHVANLPIRNGPEALYPYKLADGSAPCGGTSFCLGGKSLFWANVIPRMEPWELKYWPDDISSFLVSEGYQKAENLFRKKTQFLRQQDRVKDSIEKSFGDFAVSHLPRAYHTPTPASRKGFPDEKSTGFFSTAALLTSSMSSCGPAGPDNLTINLNQIVTNIETQGRLATAVHCYDPIRKTTRIFRGRSIVLCAGTIESARIAFTSRLNDQSNKIAVGPTYHQAAVMEFTVPDTYPLLSRYDLAQIYLRPKDNKNKDRYTCELALNWQFWDAKTEDDDIWAQDHSQPGPTKSTIKFLFRHPLNDKNHIRVSNDSCEVYIEPMSGEPLKNEVHALKDRVMKHFGVRNTGTGEAMAYQQSGDAVWHMAGSLRMGSRGRGVVSEDLRFHDYDNLYACDLSVFPDIPAANPSLTLGALALRLAKHLAA